MDYRQAAQILAEIEKTSLTSLKDSLLAAAARYAHQRATWQLASLQQRSEMDAGRTAAHNAAIDACNILSRNQAKLGEDNSWRAKLTDDRKVIGDFACFVHAILGIRGR